jgi:hypothetical protein
MTRVCLEADDRESLHDLIGRACDVGVLSIGEADVLDGPRGLRNGIVHGSLLPTFAPSAVEKMLQEYMKQSQMFVSEHQPGEESAYS